jgi:hypothetical protein
MIYILTDRRFSAVYKLERTYYSQEVKLKEVPGIWFLVPIVHVKCDTKGVVPYGSGCQVVSMTRYRSDQGTTFALASAERKNQKGNFGTTPTIWSLIALGIYHRLAVYLLLSARLLAQIGAVLTDQ